MKRKLVDLLSVRSVNHHDSVGIVYLDSVFLDANGDLKVSFEICEDQISSALNTVLQGVKTVRDVLSKESGVDTKAVYA